MKKTLIITLVAFATLALASSAFALIAGSHHDMGEFGLTAVSACEYCHTPHNAGPGTSIAGRTPLWNRTNPANTTFTAYGLTVGGTNVVNTQIGANSLTCMSCHDGVSAVGTTYNGAATDANSINDLLYGGADGRATIGQDLSNDHPVGFQAVDGRAGVPVPLPAGFTLYAGSFECASCHDPHDTTTGNTGGGAGAAGGRGGSAFFLRADWATICTDCHTGK